MTGVPRIVYIDLKVGFNFVQPLNPILEYILMRSDIESIGYNLFDYKEALLNSLPYDYSNYDPLIELSGIVTLEVDYAKIFGRSGINVIGFKPNKNALHDFINLYLEEFGK